MLKKTFEPKPRHRLPTLIFDELPSEGKSHAYDIEINSAFTYYWEDLDRLSNKELYTANAALARKVLEWHRIGNAIVFTFALATPQRTIHWCHPDHLFDCTQIANSIKGARARYFFNPDNISFKRKSKLLIRSSRRALSHLYKVNPRARYITHFARQAAARIRPTMHMTTATMQPGYWLKMLKLDIPELLHTLPQNFDDVARTDIMLPISPVLYILLMRRLEYRNIDNYNWYNKLLMSDHYFNSIVFSGFKRKRIDLLKDTWDAFDIPKHIEIDYTSLTANYLTTRMYAFGGWYGALLYVYWNFMHLYNWKFYY